MPIYHHKENSSDGRRVTTRTNKMLYLDPLFFIHYGGKEVKKSNKICAYAKSHKTRNTIHVYTI